MAPQRNELEPALGHLMSLSDGDRGVLEIVHIGQRAVPELRRRLFQREPSGLFQPRCHVVDALSALHATNVLFEFLQTDRHIPDPVERAGEDAVINAAARALRDSTDDAVYQRMMFLAESRKLVGPVEVLGVMRRPETLPCLVAALEDDLARPAAEDALRNSGVEAMAALKRAARPEAGEETESARRRRRAALELLGEIDPLPETCPGLRRWWRGDPEPTIAMLGCRFSLAQGDDAEIAAAVEQLIGMLGDAKWSMRREIEDLLCHDRLAAVLQEYLAPATWVGPEDRSPAAERQRSLLRIKARLHPTAW
jgi:hypothetical protein